MKLLNLFRLLALFLCIVCVQAAPKVDPVIDIQNEETVESAGVNALGAVNMPTNVDDEPKRNIEVSDEETVKDAGNMDDDELNQESVKWSFSHRQIAGGNGDDDVDSGGDGGSSEPKGGNRPKGGNGPKGGHEPKGGHGPKEGKGQKGGKGNNGHNKHKGNNRRKGHKGNNGRRGHKGNNAW